jgi:membrane-bound lytic murein transglycosylase D
VHPVTIRWAYALVISIVLSLCSAANADELFPRPAQLEPDIQFWTRVYTEIDTHHGFVHDAHNLSVVYETIEVPRDSRSRNNLVDRKRAHYRSILVKLAGGARDHLSEEEERVLALWPDATSKRLRAAADDLRFQLGQSDRFREGYVRAGAWLPHIQQIFAEMGLPPELGYLPHVESSFNPTAYSHAAAAGLWQFTSYTGRRFMRVDYVVDERMDPFLASRAAARLLQENYDELGSWPLALTAYNHGVNGMHRAVRTLGTTDITTILRQYQSSSFGFASRNFYVSFLAAVDVERNAEKYFGPLTRDPEEGYETVTVDAFVPVSTLARKLGVDRDALRDSNPALRSPIWKGDKYVPRGFTLRVPAGGSGEVVASALASIEPSQRYSEQIPDSEHRVSRGETLSGIAAQYGVSVQAIVQTNGLRNAHQLHIGQVLQLPSGAIGTRKPAAVEVAAVATPAKGRPVDGKYVVRQGDSLARIASRMGVDADELAALNGVSDPRALRVGQVLDLPGKGAPDAAAVVAVARNVSVPGTSPEQYVIRSGDTLATIARRFGTTESALASLNGIRNPNVIAIGQSISLGGSAAPAGLAVVEAAPAVTPDAAAPTTTESAGAVGTAPTLATQPMSATPAPAALVPSQPSLARPLGPSPAP